MLPFAARRSPVVCTGGCVASSQPLATGAGLDMLKKGGNAADAAVAAAAVLNLTEPFSTGLGGDCNCLFYDAKTHSVLGLNGSGRSPQSLTLDLLREGGFDERNPLPPVHAHLVTVPGAAAAWCDTVSLFGSKKLSLAEILQPAIELAERGFPVTEVTAFHWEKNASTLLRPGNPHGEDLLIQGRSPKSGQIFKNAHLAQTFKELAQSGKKGFYEGRIASAIVDVVRKNGGVLSLQDLREHTSTEVKPTFTDYKGVRIWELPPNGQGIIALMALNMLERFNIQELGHNSADYLHLLTETIKLSLADSSWFCADPTQVHVPVNELLSKQYCRQRSALISLQRASSQCLHGNPSGARGDTVYFSVVDKDGNACSFINSNCLAFGTGLVPEEMQTDHSTGESPQGVPTLKKDDKSAGETQRNRGCQFSLGVDHPNRLAPGKRPCHSILPALATSAATGQLLCSFGVMGGIMQPQGQVQFLFIDQSILTLTNPVTQECGIEFQSPTSSTVSVVICVEAYISVLLNMMEFGMNPQAALDAPRFHVEYVKADGVWKVSLEEGISQLAAQDLITRGHKVNWPVSGHNRSLFGRGQIITKGTWWKLGPVASGEDDADVLWAGSDPRADGCAFGY